MQLDDPQLIEAGQKDLEDAADDERESILLNSIEVLLDAAKRKNDPSLAAKANGLAERLESPSYRHVRLMDRADFLAREDRLTEAIALIERAISDAEELTDANE
jgi:hypothetical protein